MSDSRITSVIAGLSLVAVVAACQSGRGGAPPDEAPAPTPEGLAGVATSGGATAVTTVSGTRLSSRHATQIQELLQGLPGVVVSGVGANMTVRIRGTNSFLADQEPLYVLDGNILSSGVQGLMAINPDDVARIDVLRDAGSTALYGSRGANGVIVITSKKAR